MSNSIVCVDQRFAVKNSGVFCPILIFELSNLKNDDPASQSLFKVARYDYSIFFFEEQSFPVALWLRRISVGWETWVWFQHWSESLCLLCHRQFWRGNEAVIGDDWTEMLALYSCANCIVFFSSNLSAVIPRWHWQALKMNIWLQLFWSTWSLARGSDS